MNKTKPVCPVHKTAMRKPASNRDEGEKLMIRGKEIQNKFYYCWQKDGQKECHWRYSDDLRDYFKATELPASHRKTGPPLRERK